jgi:hypothetical protein
MAEYLSLGPVDPNTAMWMRDAARQERLPAIKDLDNPKYFPYRWGQAFWAYVGGTYGDDLIPLMLSTAGAAGDMNTVTKKVLGVDTKELSDAWHASIHQTYDRILAATTPPSGAGRPVIRGTEQSTGMNVGPAISPDGKWIAFLSSRGLLSVDLYIADACHRRRGAQADEHGHRPARVQHRVHLLRGNVGQREQAAGNRHGGIWTSRACDLQRAEWPQGA